MPRPLLALLLLPLPAVASPDRVAWTSADLSEATDLLVSPDGLSVLLADPSGGALAALDLRTWTVDSATTCGGSVGVGAWQGEDELRIYTGCEDGTLTWATLDGGDLSASGESVDLADGPVLGLLAFDDRIYVVTDPDDGSNPTLHAVDPETGTVDGDEGYPSTLGSSGFEDIEENGTYLLVLHGGDNLSKVDPSTGNTTSEQEALGVLDGVDLVTQSEGSSVYGAGGAAVAWFDLSGNDWSLYLDSGDGLSDVDAICLLEDAGQLLVADGGDSTVRLYSYDADSNTFGDEVEASWDYGSSGATVSEVVAVDGYAIAGTEGGELWVMTGGPWVEVSASTSSVVTDGDTISLDFQSDEDGDYEVRVGADDDDGGTLVAEGSVLAGESTTVELEVGSAFVEGDNQVRVVVVDQDGLAGHDAAVIEVDNPPSQVDLDAEDVGVGDGYLTLSITTPSDEDLASVRVYVMVSEFSADDWAAGGGPTFDGSDDLDADTLQVDVGPDESVELVISPLSNDVTYYLAVRATDAGGLEGPMSTVVTGTPLETFSASELAGEQGGFCGTPGAASLGLGLLGLGLAAARRRRGGLPAGALLSGTLLSGTLLHGTLLAVGLLAAPGTARAQEPEDEDRVLGATQVRFGPMWFDEGNVVEDVLGETGHNVLWLETGPSWRGYVQFTLGAGFYRKKATLLTSEGTTSTQDDLLWSVPLTANLSLRLDVLDEQLLVPYLTGGGDLWLWREQWTEDAAGTKSGIGGGKWGYHYGAGGQLLLDVFDRGRAGLTFSRLGIKDSYITGEWRRQEVGVFQEGLDLSNDQVTLGLSLHY